MGVHRHKITYVPKKKYPPAIALRPVGRPPSSSAPEPQKTSHHSAVSSHHKKASHCKKSAPEPTKKTVAPLPPPTPPVSINTAVTGHVTQVFAPVVQKASKKKKNSVVSSSSSPLEKERSDVGVPPITATLVASTTHLTPSSGSVDAFCSAPSHGAALSGKAVGPAHPVDLETPPQLLCYSLALCTSSLGRAAASTAETTNTAASAAITTTAVGSAEHGGGVSPHLFPSSSLPSSPCGDVFPYLLENQVRGVFFLHDGTCLQWLPFSPNSPLSADGNEWGSAVGGLARQDGVNGSMEKAVAVGGRDGGGARGGGKGGQQLNDGSDGVHPLPLSGSSRPLPTTTATSSIESVIMYVNPDGFSFMMPVESFISTGSSAEDVEDRRERGFICIPHILHQKFRVLRQIWPSADYLPSCIEKKRLDEFTTRGELSIFDDDEDDAVEQKENRKESEERKDNASILTEWAIPVATLPVKDVNLHTLSTAMHVTAHTSLHEVMQGHCSDGPPPAAPTYFSVQKDAHPHPSHHTSRPLDTPAPGCAVYYKLHPHRWVSTSSADVCFVFYSSVSQPKGLITPTAEKEINNNNSNSLVSPHLSGVYSQGARQANTSPECSLWRRRCAGYFCTAHPPTSPSPTGPCSSHHPNAFQGFLIPYISNVVIGREKRRQSSPAGGWSGRSRPLADGAERRKTRDSGVSTGKGENIHEDNDVEDDERKSGKMVEKGNEIEAVVKIQVEMSNYILPYKQHTFCPHSLELSS